MRQNLYRTIAELIKGNRPFFALSESNSDRVTLTIQHSVKATGKPDTDYIVLAEFDPSCSPHYIAADEELSFERPQDLKLSSDALKLPLDKNAGQYLRKIERTIAFLESRAVDKVVLSRKRKATLKHTPEELFKRLLNRYRQANCYLTYHPDVGLWAGATPESLLHWDGNKLKTMALAGTLPVEQGKPPEWTQKERQEQAMVTSYILKILEDSAAQNILTGPARTIRAGSIYHLKSSIEARMAKEKIMGLVAKLHPTPAVCGLPRDPALEYISEAEGYDRGFYSGYFGKVGAGRADFYVNLRCMQIHQGFAGIYAGGGITAKSDPQRELQEVNEKFQTMLAVLE